MAVGLLPFFLSVRASGDATSGRVSACACCGPALFSSSVPRSSGCSRFEILDCSLLVLPRGLTHTRNTHSTHALTSAAAMRNQLLLAASAVLAWLASAVRCECFHEVALKETNLCRNVFQRHVKEKAFNASDPRDVKEACCSIERLERCLHAASSNTGCKEETAPVVNSLIQVARSILGDVYKTKCKFRCSSGSVVVPMPRLLLSVLLPLILLRCYLTT